MLENFPLEKTVEPLLQWFRENARILPWRESPTPYHVWVSEIMLQQTRVEAVKPYYKRFMAALPTVQDLARCPQDQLLKLWEGLGYYNRVRNMQAAARTIMEAKRHWQLYGRRNCLDCLSDSGSGSGWQCPAGHFPGNGG